MFAYYAFKGLHWDKNFLALFSPVIRVPWCKKMTPWGESFCCEAAANDLERGKGIFGASIDEARFYTPQVHLVAPDPRYRLVLGTVGWRAEAAMVVDFMTTDKHAATQILAAYRAGYPQVPGILAWAARYAPPEEGRRALRDVLREPQDEEVLRTVLDSAALLGKEGIPILDQMIRGEYAKF
jgi:hypothetical protein